MFIDSATTTRVCASRRASARPTGAEGVVVKRKAAGTLRVNAHGRAAHAGSNPDAGANALLALADAPAPRPPCTTPPAAKR